MAGASSNSVDWFDVNGDEFSGARKLTDSRRPGILKFSPIPSHPVVKIKPVRSPQFSNLDIAMALSASPEKYGGFLKSGGSPTSNNSPDKSLSPTKSKVGFQHQAPPNPSAAAGAEVDNSWIGVKTPKAETETLQSVESAGKNKGALSSGPVKVEKVERDQKSGPRPDVSASVKSKPTERLEKVEVAKVKQSQKAGKGEPTTSTATPAPVPSKDKEDIGTKVDPIPIKAKPSRKAKKIDPISNSAPIKAKPSQDQPQRVEKVDPVPTQVSLTKSSVFHEAQVAGIKVKSIEIVPKIDPVSEPTSIKEADADKADSVPKKKPSKADDEKVDPLPAKVKSIEFLTKVDPASKLASTEVKTTDEAEADKADQILEAVPEERPAKADDEKVDPVPTEVKSEETLDRVDLVLNAPTEEKPARNVNKVPEAPPIETKTKEEPEQINESASAKVQVTKIVDTVPTEVEVKNVEKSGKTVPVPATAEPTPKSEQVDQLKESQQVPKATDNPGKDESKSEEEVEEEEDVYQLIQNVKKMDKRDTKIVKLIKEFGKKDEIELPATLSSEKVQKSSTKDEELESLDTTESANDSANPKEAQVPTWATDDPTVDGLGDDTEINELFNSILEEYDPLHDIPKENEDEGLEDLQESQVEVAIETQPEPEPEPEPELRFTWTDSQLEAFQRRQEEHPLKPFSTWESHIDFLGNKLKRFY